MLDTKNNLKEIEQWLSEDEDITQKNLFPEEESQKQGQIEERKLQDQISPVDFFEKNKRNDV